MQEITRDMLVKRACELLSDGTADRVLGWKAGEFAYDVTPAVFKSCEELEEAFVWNDFCGANFSKYLIKETGKSGAKVLVFLKACDTYSEKDIKKIQKGTPTKWGLENAKKMKATYTYWEKKAELTQISKEQRDQINTTMHEQLAYGGDRLAGVLNKIFSK